MNSFFFVTPVLFVYKMTVIYFPRKIFLSRWEEMDDNWPSQVDNLFSDFEHKTQIIINESKELLNIK